MSIPVKILAWTITGCVALTAAVILGVMWIAARLSRTPLRPSPAYQAPRMSLDAEPFTFSVYYADRARLDRMILDLSVPIEDVVEEVERLVRREANSAAYYREEHVISDDVWPFHPWGRFVDAGHAGYLGWFPSEGRATVKPANRRAEEVIPILARQEEEIIEIRNLAGRVVRLVQDTQHGLYSK